MNKKKENFLRGLKKLIVLFFFFFLPYLQVKCKWCSYPSFFASWTRFLFYIFTSLQKARKKGVTKQSWTSGKGFFTHPVHWYNLLTLFTYTSHLTTRPDIIKCRFVQQLFKQCSVRKNHLMLTEVILFLFFDIFCIFKQSNRFFFCTDIAWIGIVMCTISNSFFLLLSFDDPTRERIFEIDLIAALQIKEKFKAHITHSSSRIYLNFYLRFFSCHLILHEDDYSYN